MEQGAERPPDCGSALQPRGHASDHVGRFRRARTGQGRQDAGAGRHPQDGSGRGDGIGRRRDRPTRRALCRLVSPHGHRVSAWTGGPGRRNVPRCWQNGRLRPPAQPGPATEGRLEVATAKWKGRDIRTRCRRTPYPDLFPIASLTKHGSTTVTDTVSISDVCGTPVSAAVSIEFSNTDI